MNRAERRRQKRKAEKEKNPARYVFTKETLDLYVKQALEREYTEKIERVKEAAMDAAVDYVSILLFALPCEVLKDHYWVKTHKKKLPGFMDLLMEYYNRWKTDDISMDQLKADLWEYGGIRVEEK